MLTLILCLTQYSKKLKAGLALSTVMEDETNDVGNMTFGKGSTEMSHVENEPGFHFSEYSFDGSSLSLDYDEAKVSSSNDGDGDGDGDDCDKNGKLLIDESQHGCATQVVLSLAHQHLL